MSRMLMSGAGRSVLIAMILSGGAIRTAAGPPGPTTKKAETHPAAKAVEEREAEQNGTAKPKRDARKSERPPAPKAVEKAPTTKPSAKAPEPRPSEAPPVPEAAARPETPKRDIIFQFDGIPYTDVVRRFAQMTGKPLIGDLNIEGDLTFYDSEPYDYDEALDTLNIILSMRGYQLMEAGRFLQLVPNAEVPQMPLRIVPDPERTDEIRPGEIVTVVLPLKYLDAEEAKNAVVRMVSAHGSITPLSKGKGLVITDRLGSIRRIRRFLRLLDTETLIEQQLKTYTLKFTAARMVADIVTRLFGTGAPKPMTYDSRRRRYVPAPQDPKDIVTATFDERTNMLMLVGTGDRLALAEQLIEKLDTEEIQEGGDMRIFELRSANAEDLAKTILASLPEEQVGYDAKRKRPIMAKKGKVVADKATNRLIVSAPVDQMLRIEKLIQDLDQAGVIAGGARIFPLKVADAQQLTSIISNAVVKLDSRGRRISTLAVIADPRTNSLIIAGPPGDIRIAAGLIEELDKARDKDARAIHVVQLKVGDARELAGSLTRLFAQQAQSGRRGRRGAAPTSNLRVEADAGTNSLLISCAPGDWPTIESILQQLEVTAVPMATPSTRLIPLRFVKASELAGTLRQIFTGRGRGRGRQQRGRPDVPVVIAASDRSNSLLVSAAANDQETIAALVESMDVESVEQVDPVRIVRLTAADAKKVAETLRAMLPPPRRGQPPKVFVQADPLTNSVLIRGPEAERKMLEEMIASLDMVTRDEARETRVIRLEHASASAVVSTLNQLYQRAQPRGRRGRAPEEDEADRIVITAAPGDRAVIIDAPRKKIEEIAQLAITLDTKDAFGKMQVRTYKLTSGDAAEIARSLARLFAGGRSPAPGEAEPRFEADMASNQLLVAATVGQFEEIEKLIEKLQVATTLARQTQTFQLEHGRADEIAPMLQQMLTDARPDRRRRGRSPAAAQEVRVAAMSSANAVVVQGPPEKLALAERLVKTFDTPEADGGKHQVRAYTLATANASELAGSLGRIFAQQSRRTRRGAAGETQPRFEADPATNQLIVAATASQFEEIEKIIEDLQVAAVQASQTRTYDLKFAKASDMVQLLRSMLSEDSFRGRGRRGAPRAQAPVRLASLAGTNSVVIQAPPDKLALAEQLIGQFDTEETGGKVSIQIVQLEKAQAETLAQAVNAALVEQQATRGRRGRGSAAGGQVNVTAEPNSNSLLVRGPASEVPGVIAMIRQLDAESTSAVVEMRVFPLENSEAIELAVSVEKLFRDILRQGARGRRGQPSAPFSVAANERTNSLVVSTTRAYFAIVEQLLETLDKPGVSQALDVQYVWLDNANATEVALRLDSLFADRRKGDRPLIEADLFSNALTIIAKPADWKTIEPIITKLDDSAKDRNLTIRVIPLTGSRAKRMAEVLQRIYGQVSDAPVVITDKLPSRRRPGMEGLPAPAIDPEDANSASTTRPSEAARGSVSDEGMFDPDAPLPVTIAVDEQANALIVSATQRELDNIELLIAQLTAGDVEGEPEIRVIPITHADPASVAKILNDLFNPRRAAAPAPRPRTGGGRGRQAAPPAPPPVKQNIIVIADSRTRSLIIRARPSEFEMIDLLIPQLDKGSEVISDLRIFPLKNTDATEVARNIKEIFRLSTTVPRQPKQQKGKQTPQQQRAEAVRQMIEIQRKDGVTQVDAATMVTVSANRQSNSVVVAAPPEAMVIIEKIIQELDQSAAASTMAAVRLYPLRHAEVRATVTAVQQIFAQVGGRGRGTAAAGGRGAPVRVTGDEAGRLVIVSAPADKHELIAQVIRDIDRAQETDQVTVRVYRIRHADSTSVASALNGTLGVRAGAAAGRGRRGGAQSGGGGLRISADRSSNSVVVRAGKEDHERIAKLLEEIDVAPTAAQRVQLIPLNSADAANVAQILNRVFGEGAGRGRAGGGAVQRVVIEPDRDSRMLMVRADEETFAKIRILAGQLDAAPIGKATRTLLTLKHAQAVSVASALTQAFAPARGQRITPDDLVTVVAEPVSNSVIVSATPENLDKVKSLLAKLDTEETGGMRTEFVLLRNAKATELATVLSRVAGGVGGAARGGRGRGGVQQGVVVSADAGSNALVMSGPSAELDKIMKMALQLDQASSTAVSGVYIIALENGSASEVAATVRDFYNQQLQAARRDKRSVDPLAVSADTRANAVILATTPKMYTQVSQWIKQVEGMKQRIGTPRIITLEHADPAEVEKAIQQLFGGSSSTSGNPGRGGRSRGNPGPSGTGSGRVETSVMSKQRAILINASDEDYEAIVKLAKSLELAAAGTRKQVQIFRLENAMNTRVATALNAMYASAARTGAEEDRVSIVALPQTTAVVVTATKEKMAEIAGLITQLDTVEVAPQLEFRIFPLEHAMPTKVLPALRQMLQQIQRIRPDEPINVQADERTRSIIITARGTVFDQVEKIIQTLDKAPAEPVAEILIIPLKRADAASLADVLNEMLRPSATNQVTPEARALQEQVRRLRVRSTVAEQIPELDLTKPIKIQADPARPQGSNSLIIQSTPDNLKAMQAIVSVMDTVPITEGVKVRLLHLQNADVLSVMQILRSIFDQGQQLAGRSGTTVAGRADPESTTGKALVHRFNVSADLRTNTLVVSGLEESIALAELIVKDLDRQSGKIVTEVRVFRLKHASADRMLPVLRAVFAEGTPVPDAEGLQTHVTRLRTVLNDDPKRTSGLAKVRAALTIQADPSTNMLVVAARSDVMPLIADVVKTMDIPGAGSLNSVRIFPLKNADATRIRQVLTDLHSGPNAALIRDEDKPTLSVDTRTNSLIVCASDKTVVMIEMLLRHLDAAQSIDLLDIRLIPLKSADAAPMATTLQRMVDARVQRQAALGLRDAESLRVLILPDERSNSLIVGGSAESFQLVKLLAEQLDGASPALGGQIQLIPLKEANSGALAQTLVNLFNQRYQAARTPEVQRQRPVIVPDLRTNSLLVAANQDDTAILKSLLGKLDVKLVDPAVRLVVIPLKHNDAGVVGPMIQSIFQARLTSMTVAGQTPVPQDRVDVVSDALSNALVISASKENLALVEGLLAKVDVEPPTETGIVRMYLLVNSDAQRIQGVLDGLFSKGLYKPGLAVAGASAALQAREKVSIAVDVRTNVLIVSASKENFAVIDEIIKRIDATDDFGALGDVRMYLLKNADATRLGPALQQFFDAKRTAEQQTGASGRSLPVSIIADARTNTLLVAGSRESFKAVEAMLKQLDGDQATPAGEFRVFYLKQATAAALQPTLQSLFDRRVTRGQTRDQVTVLADPKTNALIVGATPEDMKLAESLIARLDAEPETPGTTVQVFPLVRADATQTADTIRNLYQSQGIPAAAAPGISVDERINALVVTGGEADMKRIAELVEQLDTDTLARVTEIRVFTLVNADATELGRILTEALTNKPTPMTAVSPNRQHILQFVTKTDDGRRLIASALQEGVLITADARTNSLVVSAPAQFMPLLEALIEAMDSTTPRIAEIRVFTLVNADCQRMGAVLTELFRLQQTTAANMRSVNYTLTTTAPSGEGASATLGTAEQYALSITVDVRTNSLLVGGTKQYVDLCSKIIEELDSCPAQERMTKVYRLRNARAGDIESALTSFLDRERAQLTSTLGPDGMGAVQRLLEREVAVVSVASDGDAANANTLLLSASPRYFKTLCEIISELDQPPPQVLIQVLLAEVRLDDTTDFGVDWNFAATSGSKSIDTGTNFGIQTDIGKSGFSLAVSGSDLGFFLRALQAQGRLEVLSRPQILASDNQEAEINVGQRVPFIRDSRITEQGTTINTLDYEDVGIILRVTPRINPDGSVRMEISPEISSIADSTVQVSEGLNAIIVNTRRAETTVTVQDGHTIVIGGLITTEDQEREDKVPLLGDLPGLGWLFKRTKLVKVRTELLIILTPHVLRNVEEADAESQKQFRGLDLLGEMETEDVLKQKALRPIRGLRGEAEAPEVVPEPAPGSPISLELVPRLERKRPLPRAGGAGVSK